MRLSLRTGLLTAAVGFASIAALPGAARAEVVISWRVENAFRFFDNPADTEMHRATYQALEGEQRRTPVLSAERALAARHEDGWAAAMAGPLCWDAVRNRHRCKDADSYIKPKSHAVLIEATGIEDAANLTCTWGTAPIGGARSRGEVIVKPCTELVRLDVPYPASLKVSLEIGGQPVGEALVRVTDLLIVGMGDSFGSGEGNPDVPIRFSAERAVDYGDPKKAPIYGGYPARVGSWRQIGDRDFIAENSRWLDQACHRSMYSNQLRAALQLAIEDPHRAVTFVGLACSGAEITAGLFLRYKGNEWVPNPPELSQISAVAEAQCGAREAPLQDLPEAYHMNGQVPDLQGGLVLRKCDATHARKIDLIFLSIGGNDIGFARLVANAVLADQSNLRRLGGWFGQVFGLQEARAKLETLDDRYKALNRAFHNILHLPWTENDRVILTGYPGLALLEDGRGVCPTGQAGMDVLADFNLSREKAQEGSLAADDLNAVMRQSARGHGWTFADAHVKEFLGRGLCAGFASSSFSKADDLRMPRRLNGQWEPYNPSEFRAYASRQRWFRTPNDAFMTGNFHVSATSLQSVLKTQSLSWVQILLAATYSGAFHPTAEGHAAIADAIVVKARGVLERYSGRHRDK